MTAFPFDVLIPSSTSPRAPEREPAVGRPATALGSCDILPLAAYERLRPRYTRLLTELKRHRRARLSPHVGMLLENRETVLHQIHEVLRLEGHSPAHVRRELAQYACLVPRPGELRATVMIDGGTADEGRALATALRQPGAITLSVDGLVCNSTLASGDDPCDAEDPVQYLRWAPEPAFVHALRRRGAQIELALRTPTLTPPGGRTRRFVTFAHQGLRGQLRDDLGPPPGRSLLHTLHACPWMLIPTRTPHPWPY